MKLLSDKREVDSLHGRIAVGFLIVQDIAVVLAMIVLSAAGVRAEGRGGPLGIAGVLVGGVVLLAQVPAAAALSAFVLVGNPLIVMAIMGYMGYRKRTGFLAGLTVAQISEFSLVFMAMGVSLGHIAADSMALVTLVGLITITLSTKWTNNFFWNLFGYEWELTKSPAGAHQWKPKGEAGAGTVPHAFDRSKRIAPSMLTTDLALRFDPAYEKISRRFMENPDQFADAFARAWFKLTHRDMGPVARYLGPLVPKAQLAWQDPIPAVNHPLIGEQDITALKAKLLASGLTISQLVSTAWASASTFRGSDKRGGANGARIRLARVPPFHRSPPVWVRVPSSR